MIIVNRHTREKREISYENFRKEFKRDIERAYQSYRQTCLNKPTYKYNDDQSIEFNFYFELHWNFNNHGNSAWYIERI